MADAQPSLHILVLTDRDWSHPQAGGTGTNLHAQVSRWIGWGHRVSVIACGYAGGRALERADGLTVHRMGGRSTVFPRAIWKQWRGLVPDADVVLEVINGITFLTPLWMRTPRVALIHHIHRRHYVEEMGLKGRVAGFLLETAPLRMLYGSTRFITVSKAGAADVAAHGVPADRIVVNYNGNELGHHVPGVRAARPTLLYLGRLKRYKHVDVLLDAVEQIPGAVLELAGDGDQRGHVEREIRRRGIGDRVRMHGFVDDKRKLELLQAAWVNVTASAVEGWGLTVAEAAACGTPSVARRVGGLAEAIVDGETGLLADDAADLIRKTRRVVDDAGLRERLGAAALERIRGFTWERTASRTLAVLQAAHASAHARPEPAGAVAAEAAIPPAAAVGRAAVVEETEVA